MSPTVTQATFVDLGVDCRELDIMPGHFECTPNYVTTAPAVVPQKALLARSVVPSGLSQVCMGRKQYVNLSIFFSVGFLVGLLMVLIVMLCVRRHKKKKSGK